MCRAGRGGRRAANETPAGRRRERRTAAVLTENGDPLHQPGSPTVRKRDQQPRFRDADATSTHGPWVGADEATSSATRPEACELRPAWAKSCRQTALEDEPTRVLAMSVAGAEHYPEVLVRVRVAGLTTFMSCTRPAAGRHASCTWRPPPEDWVNNVGHSIRTLGGTPGIDTVGYNDKSGSTARQPALRAAAHIERGRARAGASRTTSRSGSGAHQAVKLHLSVVCASRQGTGKGPDGFICLEDNEYGQAAQIRIGTGTDGKNRVRTKDRHRESSDSWSAALLCRRGCAPRFRTRSYDAKRRM